MFAVMAEPTPPSGPLWPDARTRTPQRSVALGVGLFLGLLVMIEAVSAAGRDAERLAMVEDIVALSRVTAVAGRPIEIGAPVLEAMRAVPREEFVPDDVRGEAYRNRPLAIGHGQTISQPFIVALMTHLLEPEAHHRVLEIGTGSGYQAAVLARLAGHVYSIEIVEELALGAAATFERLGIKNISAKIGDGYAGWPEHAPFDGIIVTAAPDHVPEALVRQLKPGGRLVIPVGSGWQELLLIEKKPDGTTVRTEILPVRFVPLTRQ